MGCIYTGPSGSVLKSDSQEGSQIPQILYNAISVGKNPLSTSDFGMEVLRKSAASSPRQFGFLFFLSYLLIFN